MKIALLQTDIQWLDAAHNLREAERLLCSAPDADLYVLPEMWATGFCTAPEPSLHAQAEEALAWMRDTACRRGCAVAGSLAVRVAAEEEVPEGTPLWRNRFYFVRDDGTFACYDKRNLFAYGGEQQAYAAGGRRAVVEWRGVRFMLQTCFDLRFPETARNTLASTYDVLLYVANWPTSRRGAWDVLLPARAVENQAYVVGVNRTGSDPQCLYDGGSAAYDPYGRPCLRLDAGVQAAVLEPDMEMLARFREKFKVLR